MERYLFANKPKQMVIANASFRHNDLVWDNDFGGVMGGGESVLILSWKKVGA